MRIGYEAMGGIQCWRARHEVMVYGEECREETNALLMWLWGKGMDQLGKQDMGNVVMEQGDGIREIKMQQVCGYRA